MLTKILLHIPLNHPKDDASTTSSKQYLHTKTHSYTDKDTHSHENTHMHTKTHAPTHKYTHTHTPTYLVKGMSSFNISSVS